MTIELGRPGVAGLIDVLSAMREWQADAEPVQLHPGDLGSSSALVVTPSSNVGAVATYRSVGFQALPERLDRVRAA